ncbi:MAG: hypothetical protein U9P90_00605 [Patescibacteria group bacterium]|nr:hypothetical protein [Patescibacteria group bacterium]
MMRKKTSLKFLIAIIFFFFLPCIASAESANIKEEFRTGLAITMSPVTFELTADPGDVVSNVIKVSNPSENSIGVRMDAEDFVAVGETGKVAVLEEENETYSLKKWITTYPEYFVLGPGEAKVINFSINVPHNAEPGGHYASVLSVVTADTGPGSGSAITQKVGALVLLSVSGEVREELIIKEFSAPKFMERGPVPLVIRFENIGSVHVRPIGFVSISNSGGEKIDDIAFPQKNILPGAKRKLEVTWDKKFLFGKYTADLVGSYGNSLNNKPIFASIEFWVIPWKIMSVIILSGLLIIVFLCRFRNRIYLALRILIKGK